MVGVKNNGSDKLKAMFDGREYVFVPGETCAMSDEAAEHIFGYGHADDDVFMTRVLSRLGWLGNSAQLEQAKERLNEFQYLGVESIKYEEPAAKIPRSVKEGGTLHLPNPPADKQSIKT